MKTPIHQHQHPHTVHFGVPCIIARWPINMKICHKLNKTNDRKVWYVPEPCAWDIFCHPWRPNGVFRDKCHWPRWNEWKHAKKYWTLAKSVREQFKSALLNFEKNEKQNRRTNNSPGNQHPACNRSHWKQYVFWCDETRARNEKIPMQKCLAKFRKTQLDFPFDIRICFSNARGKKNRIALDTKWDEKCINTSLLWKLWATKQNSTIHFDHLEKQFINRIHWNFIKIQHWFTFPECIRPMFPDI